MNKTTRIWTLLVIDSAFFLLELITGYAVNSLALIADAFHMFNDILSLIVALWAVQVAKKKATATYTYGLERAEILGALVNGVFLIALCVNILLEAIQRFISVPEVLSPKFIMVVGSLGLVSNFVGLALFHEHGGHSHDHDHGHGQSHDQESQPLARSNDVMLPEEALEREESRLVGYGSNQEPPSPTSPAPAPKPKPKAKSMNMEGVWLHVLGDALGNIGVIISALFIWKTNYSWRMYADPFVSLVITCIILSTALPLCKRASKVLLQATPSSVNASEVRRDLAALEGVVEIHDLHIWQLNEHTVLATVHVLTDKNPAEFPDLSASIQKCFISHGVPAVTVQPEFASEGPRNGSCTSYGNLSTGGLSIRKGDVSNQS